jgi:hypothetical protein
MLPLPLDVLRIICAFDPTYRHVFITYACSNSSCCSAEHRFPRRVLKRVRVDRVLWAWAGDVPVVLSWTSPGKSVGTGHSDMPGCGCNKCAHGRPKPRPARPKPKPKPKGGEKRRYGR